MRLGIVDLDSSHCVEFTRRFNHVGVDREQFVGGAQVVAAWSGGSEMAPERIPGFQTELERIGVEVVTSPDEVLSKIDGVLVLSLCGAAHLERARPFLEAGVPTFVDKPFACCSKDASAIVELARQHNATLLSSSALRFSEDVLAVTRHGSSNGHIHGALTFGPAKRADGNPGLFHYGIHSVELLFELLGSNCESVCSTWTDGAEVVTGRWSDGRIGTVRGNRQGTTYYGFAAFCEDTTVTANVSTRFAYRNLCREIVRTFETGTPAVPHDSSVAVVRFIEAALESERSGGTLVSLSD